MKVLGWFAKIVLPLAVLGGIAIGMEIVVRSQVLASPPIPATVLDEAVLRVSPVDPEQVVTVTRFRSCIRSDDSGTTADGTQEFQRNMSHIVTLWPHLRAQPRSVPIRAPFDAVVSDIPSSSLLAGLRDGPSGDELILVAASDPNWRLTIRRIDVVDEVTIGARFATGDVLGHVAENEASFDIKLHHAEPLLTERLRAVATGTPAMATPRDRGHVVLFDHLIESERLRWQAQGFDLDLMAISREDRNDRPCPDGQFFDAHTYVPDGNYDRCLSWRQFHRGTVARDGYDAYGEPVDPMAPQTATDHPCGSPPLVLPSPDEIDRQRIPEPDA